MDFGHPNMSMPPPMGPPGPQMGSPMGPPMGPPPSRPMRHNFRPYNTFQLRFPPQGPLNMTQDDFDGKRLRKSVMRKTVDYNASIIKALECRVWQRDWRDRHALQPDAMYTPDLLPPPSYPDNPINAVTTRFVKTATNKMRCPVFAVAWTPEGRRLITGTSSGEFTLWNGLTFNFETILQAHDSPVRSMVWSHGEGWMVTGDHSGYIKYWQSNMNNVKMYQAHKEAVRGISFSPSDSKIVTCSDDGTLRIFDFYRCQEERIMRGHGADVKCVQWHPSKSLIVSGSKDNQQPIKLWDPKSGTALSTLHAHKSTVMDLKWNENGNWLITASRDHLLKLFDIRKLGTEMQVFRGHKKEASSVAWHPHHEGLFCSGGSDGAILFWNVGTDKEVGCIEGSHESIVWTMAWHPLGHILCTGSNDHTCKFWTRNRPGDLMRDKYNLNTLPPGVQDDQDLEEPAAIPGMGPEDKVDIFSSNAEKVIPGLDLDTTSMPMDFDKKVKKVPYSKPIPRSFQAQWNDHSLNVDDNNAHDNMGNQMDDSKPGSVPLRQITPTAIFIYGKLIQVHPGSKLEKAIIEGPAALKNFIASGELEELNDVMPHLDGGMEEIDNQVENVGFIYPGDNNFPQGPNGPPMNVGPRQMGNMPPCNYMGPGMNQMRPMQQFGNMPPGGPPMGNMHPGGPPMGNMPSGGPPMNNIPFDGPPMKNMQHGGPPMNKMQHGGPPMNNMSHGGPPMNNMAHGGPPMGNMQRGGPHMDNMSSRGPMGNMQHGGPPIGNMSHGGPLLGDMPSSGPMGMRNMPLMGGNGPPGMGNMQGMNNSGNMPPFQENNRFNQPNFDGGFNSQDNNYDNGNDFQDESFNDSFGDDNNYNQQNQNGPNSGFRRNDDRGRGRGQNGHGGRGNRRPSGNNTSRGGRGGGGGGPNSGGFGGQRNRRGGNSNRPARRGAKNT